MLPPDELRFVELLRRRDERAFNELVRTHWPRVYGLVYRMLGRADVAEDVTQDVFVQAFKAIDQFRGDARLSTWLFRIAVNTCKNRSKYLSRREDGRQELEAMAERAPLNEAKGVTSSDVGRPDEAYDGREVERVVREGLARVEADFREVVVLRDVEGLSYEEIGQITGLAEGTVKSRLHRGRAQLRAYVEAALGEKVS
ncbi:MAG TPA: sigma-70 family RNA polymerase sigma factor [Polyangiaceae bacterium]|nr:sigma-70 family RNA polymerase sigma factor [Polyangiaceae bacterium]